jgi:hypothetical protein
MTMSRVLFVDDEWYRYLEFKENNPDVDIYYADTVEKGIEKLTRFYPFDVIMLDHDMCDEDYKDLNRAEGGEYIARYIVANPHLVKETKNIVVHSLNDGGAQRMVQIIRDCPEVEPEVEAVKFGWKTVRVC